MCRLFGLPAGKPVDAEFWLLEAPASLAAQSVHSQRHRHSDQRDLRCVRKVQCETVHLAGGSRKAISG
jgi:hypothetical protein